MTAHGYFLLVGILASGLLAMLWSWIYWRTRRLEPKPKSKRERVE